MQRQQKTNSKRESLKVRKYKINQIQRKTLTGKIIGQAETNQEAE